MLSENLQLTAVDSSLAFCTICIAHLVQIYILKLSFGMWTVHGQRYSFSTHWRMFFWKCRSFWNRNVSTRGALELPTFVFMPNAPTIWVIRARHLLPHVFNTGSEYCIPNSWSINLVNKVGFILSLLTTRSRKSYEFSPNFISHHPCVTTPFERTATFPGAIGLTMILTYDMESNKSLIDSQYLLSQG